MDSDLNVILNSLDKETPLSIDNVVVVPKSSQLQDIVQVKGHDKGTQLMFCYKTGQLTCQTKEPFADRLSDLFYVTTDTFYPYIGIIPSVRFMFTGGVLVNVKSELHGCKGSCKPLNLPVTTIPTTSASVSVQLSVRRLQPGEL